MPEFGICPTIISSSESVRRLSSESVRVAVGIEFQNPFPSHSHRISVGIPTKTHRKKDKNPKKNPRNPTESHRKKTRLFRVFHWKTRNNRRTDSAFPYNNLYCDSVVIYFVRKGVNICFHFFCRGVKI